ADVGVPQLEELAWRTQTRDPEGFGVVVADHSLRDVRLIDRSFQRVAAGLRHDAERRSTDFRFTETAGRGRGDFLSVPDVRHVARHAGAVERRAGVQAIHLETRLVVPATGAAEHQHAGRHLDVEI